MFIEIYNLVKILINLIKKTFSQQNNIDYNQGRLYKCIYFGFDSGKVYFFVSGSRRKPFTS